MSHMVGGLLIHHTFPLDGEYLFKIRLWRNNSSSIRGLFQPHDVEITIDGERVFLNPPYGREVYAWTRKAAQEAGDALIVGLLPASTDLAWWHDDVVAAGAEVRYIRGRVRFLTGGPYRASGFFASVIVIWREKVNRAPVLVQGDLF
jgi:site-specific DNA-methyltransferase (adenine-specific)